MYAIKKELMKSNFIDTIQSQNNTEETLINNFLPMLSPEKGKSLILKEKIVFSNNINNDDINLNTKLKLSDYYLKLQNEDYNNNNNLSKFTNYFYNKFKKVFLINLKIKVSSFIPKSEINERQKLIN
jgi:hypothetical protein